MTTIEVFEKLADDTPDSKLTKLDDILFFYSDTSGGEALKKLKNHKFKIGYAYDIDLDGTKYTRIIAYNLKNDIFRGWFVHDYSNGIDELKLPEQIYKFPSLITACRFVDGRDGNGSVLKVFKENCHEAFVKKFHEYGRFNNKRYVTNVDDLNYFGLYWPVLGHPDIEQYRQLQILHGQKDIAFYSDVASICNIYKFGETYEYFDEGLKEIYRVLYENYEKKFCEEINNFSLDTDMVDEVLNLLNLSMDDLKEIFEKNEMNLPVFINNEFKTEDKKIVLFEKLKGSLPFKQDNYSKKITFSKYKNLFL